MRGGGLLSNLTLNKAVQANSDFLTDLQEKLPEFFTNSGSFDIEKFKANLKENDIDELTSGYQLKFIGKNYARKQVGELPTTLIVPDDEHNKKLENANSNNLFFTGDNLEVLRHLRANYQNSIDFIYIDPPYNTGSDGFVYSDKFEYSDEKLVDLFGLSDDELRRLKSILGKSSHSAWLAFMYPRLKLAQKLLKKSGVIFVSIDDNEQANLKLLMDEIFGEDSFVSEIVINKASEIADENTIQKHEYILVYSKRPAYFMVDGIPKYSVSRGTVGNENQTMPEIEFPAGIKAYNIEDGVYEETRKVLGSKENIENLSPIIIRDGSLAEPVILKAKWRSSNDMRRFFANNMQPTKAKINGVIEEIYFENDKFNPQIKKATYEKIPDLILDNKRGSKWLENYGLGNFFDNPKSVQTIKKLIQIVTSKKDARILDFFAGSATTADAVMQLNAEDGGSRYYLMVQLPEPIEESKTAFKAGYKTIDEISRVRIAKAADKIREANPLLAEQMDLGFKHYRVEPININTIDKMEFFDPNTLVAEDILSHIQGGVDTLLVTWMVSDGYQFNEPIEKISFGNSHGYYLNNSLLYILENSWNSESNKELLNMIGKTKIYINTIIVSEYALSFGAMSELKANIKILKDKDFNIKVEVRG